MSLLMRITHRLFVMFKTQFCPIYFLTIVYQNTFYIATLSRVEKRLPHKLWIFTSHPDGETGNYTKCQPKDGRGCVSPRS